MAVKGNTRAPASKSNESIVVTWSAMATGDTGEPVSLAEYGDRTFQVGGTIGGATLTIEGSNDGTTWNTLNDCQGVALALTTAAIKMCRERPMYVRPNCSGGAGVAIVVTACVHRRDLSGTV